MSIADLLMHDALSYGDPGVDPSNPFLPVDVLLPVIGQLLRTGGISRAGARAADVPMREQGSVDAAAAGDLACFEARGMDRPSDCCGVRSAPPARRR